MMSGSRTTVYVNTSGVYEFHTATSDPAPCGDDPYDAEEERREARRLEREGWKRARKRHEFRQPKWRTRG